MSIGELALVEGRREELEYGTSFVVFCIAWR